MALERTDGLLIERLLDAGLAVIAVHPNQVKASRPRYSVAGGKSDRFDSFVLAELARTDSHRFRVLKPDSDQTKALRSMTRARESLVRTRGVGCSEAPDHVDRSDPRLVATGDRSRDLADAHRDEPRGHENGAELGHGGEEDGKA